MEMRERRNDLSDEREKKREKREEIFAKQQFI